MSKVKSLAALGGLLQQAGIVTNPVINAVSSILSDGRPKSTSEILEELERLQLAGFDPTLIKPTLKEMVGSGLIFISAPAESNSVVKYANKASDETKPMRALDNWIFDLMSDGANWTLEDIAGEALIQDLDRRVVKDRVVVLSRKDWFNRVGKGDNAGYSLKKTVKRPTPLTVVKSAAKDAEEPKEKEMPQVKVPSVEEIKAPATPVGKHPFDHAFFMSKLPENYSSAIDMFKDTFAQAIWKLMSDYATYSSSEIAILLDGYELTNMEIQRHIYNLKMSGWFDIHPGNRYSLKKEIAFPSQFLSSSTGREARVPAKTLHQIMTYRQKKQEESANDSVSEKIIETVETFPDKIVEVVTPTEATKEAALFSLKIKGVDFTFEELGAVVRELREKLSSINAQSEGLVSIKHEVQIKGVNFNRDELNLIIETVNRFITQLA